MRIRPPGQDTFVMDQPNVALVNRRKSNPVVLAIGNEALDQAANAESGCHLEWPYRRGVIKDYAVAVQTARMAFKQSGALTLRSLLRGPTFVMIVSADSGDIERRGFKECFQAAGAGRIIVGEQCQLADAGTQEHGIGTENWKDGLVASLGAGLTEIAAIREGWVIAQTSCPVGGWDMDAAIVTAFRRHRRRFIDRREAEAIRLAAYSEDPFIQQAVNPVLDRICEVIWDFLEATLPQLPPEMSQTQLTLAGGVAMAPGLKERLQTRTSFPLRLPPVPNHAAIRGAAVAAERLDIFKS